MKTNNIILEKTGEDTVHFTELKSEYLKLLSYNTNIKDNLLFASTIQQGLFPKKRHFNRLVDEHFVFYKPKDIISGDLYWITWKGDKIFFAVGDCTGHGVSGALLSVLGISFLNYVVLSKDHHDLGEMLTEIDKKWIETFSRSGDVLENNEWMEITLCSFDLQTRQLCFAGAKGNLLLINNKEKIEMVGDKYPIGGWQIQANRKFNEQCVILSEQTSVYLSSDGYKDQIGGEHEKKYSKKKLFSFIQDTFDLPMHSQLYLLKLQLEEWQKDNVQTDDICVMGLKL